VSSSVKGQLFDDALQQYQAALKARRQKSSHVLIVQLPAEANMDTRGFPTGSIGVFVASKDSPVLARVAKLARARDAEGLAEVIKESAKAFLAVLSSGRTSYESYDQVPVFGELRYGRQRLAHGFFVDEGRPLAVEMLPYNGGRLQPEHFIFVEYTRDDLRKRLACVVVVKPPVLSTLEREVERKVPEESKRLEIIANIEGNTLVPVTLFLLAIVVTVLVLYWAYCQMVDPKVGIRRNDILSATDPGASARSLLEQRTRAIKSKRSR
jgi:hypothetical protein